MSGTGRAISPSWPSAPDAVVTGQRRPRGETRRQILRLAARWLQQRGYHGFTFAQIADALEIRSGAVHYHFPTKDDLVAAVFARYRASFAWWTRQPVQAEASALTRIERFLDLEARNAGSDGVCPLGVAGVEYASLPAAACSEAEALRDDRVAWLAETLAAGRQAGELAFVGAPRDQARLIMAAAQGGLQLARVHGARDFEAVRRAILAGLAPSGA